MKKYVLARPLSGIILSVCIYIVAYLLVPKIKNCVKRDYIIFGIMWFILTNLFDLSSYIKAGDRFAGLLQSYNIFTGNLWLLVVLSALFSPMIVMKIKEKKRNKVKFQSHGEIESVHELNLVGGLSW